jgi:hypothetical protein
MTAWHRVVRSHSRYVAILVGTCALGVATLVLGYYGSGFGRDVLLRLGFTLLGAVITVLILEPLIRRSQTPDEIIHRGFPHDKFITGVRDSTTDVRILSAWPYVMEEPWRRQFFQSVTVALSRRVDVRLLVLDPTSQAARQRAQDMDGSPDAITSIAEALVHINEFTTGLPEAQRELFQTRVYSRLPPARLYSWDRRAISSFFPLGNWRGDDIKHYETGVSSGLGSFVNEQFELLWNDSETESLRDYMKLGLSVVSQASRRLIDVLYCRSGGQLYVVSQPLIAHLFSLREEGHTVRLVVSRSGRPFTVGQHLTARAIATHDDNDTARGVLAALHQKYGVAMVQLEGPIVPIRLDLADTVTDHPPETRVQT